MIVVDFAWIVASNENFGWPVVAQYFFDPTVIKGLYVSLGLTVVAMILGVALGLVLAIARMSNDRLASSFASLFIWFFRGTPLLVQLIFWYNHVDAVSGDLDRHSVRPDARSAGTPTR